MEFEKRCKWCNLKNPKYIEYYDKEWGIPNFDNHYLYEMLILGNYSVPCLGHIAFGKNRENKISVSLLFYYENWITFECNCQMLLLIHRHFDGTPKQSDSRF